MIEESDHGEAALLEICVDRLLRSPDWEHPTQVLERPRPDFKKLLEHRAWRAFMKDEVVLRTSWPAPAARGVRAPSAWRPRW